jgi:hypothetical protein
MYRGENQSVGLANLTTLVDCRYGLATQLLFVGVGFKYDYN